MGGSRMDHGRACARSHPVARRGTFGGLRGSLARRPSRHPGGRALPLPSLLISAAAAAPGAAASAAAAPGAAAPAAAAPGAAAPAAAALGAAAPAAAAPGAAAPAAAGPGAAAPAAAAPGPCSSRSWTRCSRAGVGVGVMVVGVSVVCAVPSSSSCFVSHR
ncbi:unnamed protein product [Closterium sp. NIES-54]